MKDRENDAEALRDELRWLRRTQKKAVVRAAEAQERASGIERPIVEVMPPAAGGLWHRVYVNGHYIDGEETADVAEQIAQRLREAFEMPKRKMAKR